jgi:hypothetical protein
MNDWADGKTGKHTDRQMDGRMDEFTDKWMDG